VDNVPLSPINSKYIWRIEVPVTPGVDQFNSILRGQSINFMGRAPGTYTIKLTNMNSECGGSENVEHTINMIGSIIPLFNITPNPASGNVTISLMEDVYENETLNKTFSRNTNSYTIQLWSSQRLIKTVQTYQTTCQLDLTGLPAGLYYVHVINDGKAYRQKLIIK
jgi:hypothetical protein